MTKPRRVVQSVLDEITELPTEMMKDTEKELAAVESLDLPERFLPTLHKVLRKARDALLFYSLRAEYYGEPLATEEALAKALDACLAEIRRTLDERAAKNFRRRRGQPRLPDHIQELRKEATAALVAAGLPRDLAERRVKKELQKRGLVSGKKRR